MATGGIGSGKNGYFPPPRAWPRSFAFGGAQNLRSGLSLAPTAIQVHPATPAQLTPPAVEGKRYLHDAVIEGGNVRKRRKGPSKPLRERFGHTPLSAKEEIP